LGIFQNDHRFHIQKELIMATSLKKTPLHGWHVANGANMADFGGYEMPLWYSSAKAEHLSVLTNAGMFDTTHMAVVMVSGAGAFDLLQHCFTKDLNACVGKDKGPIAAGRCVYGAFLNEKGEVLDDTIIGKLNASDFMVVVNAAMGGPVAGHLKANQGGLEVDVTDLSDQVGKIDIQGPLAAKILAPLLADAQAAFEKLVYFSFKGHFQAGAEAHNDIRLSDGTPILLSRTGYTGEFGFELFLSPDKVVDTWEALMASGKDQGLMSCGLAARDSLRGGAVLPLSHQDVGHWPFIHHPWDFALPFNDAGSGFTKEFIGDKALLAVASPEHTFTYIGKDLRKVSTSDPAVVFDADGNDIGTVLTCVTDMGIGRQGDRIYSIASPDAPAGFKPRGLCCGFIKVKTALEPGDVVELRDNRRKLKVTITEDVRPDRTARVSMSKML
jgi:glycine cleavage system T protein (aminomethyltransferase)